MSFIRSPLVTPGEALAVEEEALPVFNAYADGSGYVRAMIVGRPIFDRYKKTLSVRPALRRDLLLKTGAFVEAQVISLSEDLAFLQIYLADGLKVRATGVLHISQASETRIESLYDVLRPGDIVRAKVLKSSIPYQLTIKEPGLGVIETRCSVCGAPLYKAGNSLVCRVCDNVESRPVGAGYVFILR